MFSKKKGAAKKKTGLGSFFKTKKALALSLAACLVVAASVYVASAKFSASDKDYLTGWENTSAAPISFTAKIVKTDGKTVATSNDFDSIHWDVWVNGKKNNTLSQVSTGATKGWATCKKGSTKRICAYDGKSWLPIDKIYPVAYKGKTKVSGSTKYFIGSTKKNSTVTVKMASASVDLTNWTKSSTKIKYTVTVADKNGKAVVGATVNLQTVNDKNIKDGSDGESPRLLMGVTDNNGTVTLDTFNICQSGSKKRPCYTLAFQNNAVFIFDKLNVEVTKDGKDISSNRYFSYSTIKDPTINIKTTSVTGTGAAVKSPSKVTSAAKSVGSKLTETFSKTNLTTTKPTYTVTVPAKKIPSDNNVALVIELKQCFEKGEAGHPDGGCLDFKTPAKRYRIVTTQLVNGKYTASFGTINIPMKNSLGVTVNRAFWYDAGDTTKIVKSLRVVDPSDKATMDLLKSTKEVTAKDVDSQISKKLLVPMKKAPNY